MKYPFEVVKMQVEGHAFWVAKSTGLKGCVAQADSCEDAINLLAELEEEWLETAKDVGISIPEINIIKEQELSYSGKFTIRMSKVVHRKAAEAAKSEGISLNQYVNDAIVEKNTLASIYAEKNNGFCQQKERSEKGLSTTITYSTKPLINYTCH